MSSESIYRMESKIDSVLATMETFPPKYRWCKEQFGPEGTRWTARVGHTHRFEFTDECDLMLFILRWL